MEAIIADLAARYPDGFHSFTRGGRRTVAPNIYRRKDGFSVNVNGIWLSYDSDGNRINGPLGRRPPPRPQKPKRFRPRFKRTDREFIARKIQEIEGLQI